MFLSSPVHAHLPPTQVRHPPGSISFFSPGFSGLQAAFFSVFLAFSSLRSIRIHEAARFNQMGFPFHPEINLHAAVSM